jgi:hypothetical protein
MFSSLLYSPFLSFAKNAQKFCNYHLPFFTIICEVIYISYFYKQKFLFSYLLMRFFGVIYPRFTTFRLKLSLEVNYLLIL